MFNYRRSHHCGQLRAKNIGEAVTLSGWVNRRRDHGGLIFIDLRDYRGITQLVFDPQKNPEEHAMADSLRAEWVISIKGEVIPRAEGMVNTKLDTGEVEISVNQLEVLSKAKTPPFSVCDDFINVNEELRLKHRYLDLRRGEIDRNLRLRHQVCQIMRDFLNGEEFVEVTTPLLGKSTPEGSRDYLVPSRVHPGNFYALPQSPQLFKQLLMVGGMDRYYQIATCVRDEDLRADRQPEFAQLDLEMSFETMESLFTLIEKLVGKIFKECKDFKAPESFRRIPYAECIERYGTDKPDLRFGMELFRVDDLAEKAEFSVFHRQLESGGCIKALCVKDGTDLSRRLIDDYTQFISKFGVQGLAWMKMQDGSLNSNIVKFFPEEVQKALIERLSVEDGDLVFFVAEAEDRVNQAMDQLRRKLARDRELIPENSYEILWVTEFPMYGWNDEENRLQAEHHPFTHPDPRDYSMMESEPLKVRSLAYDLVINGYEAGGGSQRIHEADLQARVFQSLNLEEEEIKDRFGFFVEALSYGTPPHLGIALGLDRLIMILAGTDNIRDVIAFPKTQRATDLMTEAPSNVRKEQLLELHLNVTKSELKLS